MDKDVNYTGKIKQDKKIEDKKIKTKKEKGDK